ncbi:MAG: hypothetical protein HY069_02505 [Chlamydiia bacterium]|nr:hypothetical protein [Chlamydiia bacterium]
MKLYTQIPSDFPPCSLTIGTFDGLHRGHVAILKRLQEISSHPVVLTFANHPLELIRPPAPLALISRQHKLELFQQLGIKTIIELPFTPELASLSYQELLSRFPLTHLILGEGSVFGHERKGTQEQIERYAQERKFIAEYLPKIQSDSAPISSTRIREAIAKGDLTKAKEWLGRSHGLYLSPQSTLVHSLILPPDGKYSVRVGSHADLLEITSLSQGRHLSLQRPLVNPTFITFESVLLN